MPPRFNSCSSRLAKIEFCLNEWKTGVLVRQNLHEPILKEKYSGHLRDVLKWDGLEPVVTKNIRQKIFDDLRYAQVKFSIYLILLLTLIPQRVCGSSRHKNAQYLLP